MELKFKKGTLVKITGNINGHRFNIGETVRLVENIKGAGWKAEHLGNHYWWWYVMECDMEPIESVEDKTTDNHKFTYNVGDRVVSGGHTGQVIGIDPVGAPIAYLVDFDEPGVGLYNGNGIGVTVGRCGTSNNCLWCLDNELQPIESNPEPTKLYCIKGEPGWLTKGKIYDFDGGIICYDNGHISKGVYESYASFDEYKLLHRCFLAGCLVPLVKRTAKVGEWIYVIEDNGGCVKAGTIWKVTNVDSKGVDLMGNYVCRRGNYLVLDGYRGE